MRPLPLEPVRRALLQRAVHPDVGLTVEPREHTGVEIVVGDEVPAIEEALADVPDRPFHLALRLRPVGAACPDPEAPVMAEAQELRVLDQPTALCTPSSMITAFIWSNNNSDGTPPKYRNAESSPRITTGIVWRS